ncbi:FIST C-terminal domain-containing protein [Thiomicrospira microaerophila]|uniref:FIST signal transduction protein n=1 Tax=Thiomicrospira microaerophila TaxID=406020 RepID=UPI00200CCE25|nr:FIST C-terminal domain-containing protein [Thiomicrospira microaerophila]UQB41415.1 FIST C-terminal domain-containing protein [Thiomicrospira microaerophila]
MLLSQASTTLVFSEKQSFNEFKNGLSSIKDNPQVKSVLIFSADNNNFDENELDQLLKQQTISILGGIFPEIVYQTKSYSHGFLMVGLPYEMEVGLVEGLSDPALNYADLIESLFADQLDAQTGLVFVDGLSKRISGLVDGLFEVFGSEVNFIGGGAGSLSFIQKPCLLSQHGLLMDAALIALIDKPSRLAVGHGWKTIHPDHQVTQVDKNIIYQIDNRNAFEVYGEVVNQHSIEAITRDNFFSIAQAFPFGINKLNGDKVVRDPIAVTPEGGLVCVGELSQGDFVDILSAKAQDLVESAGQTTRAAYATEATQTPVIHLTIDCISRGLFLKQAFVEELDAIRQYSDPHLPIVGALVLGEIANSGEGYLEFYNKTTAIAVL